MSRKRQHLMWAVLVVALLGLTAAALWTGPSRRLGGGTSEAGRGIVVAPATPAAEGLSDHGVVPDFHLVSQTGDSVHLRDLRGRPWIADFIFTHCAGTCPLMTAQLAHLDETLDTSSGVRL